MTGGAEGWAGLVVAMDIFVGEMHWSISMPIVLIIFATLNKKSESSSYMNSYKFYIT